MNNKIILILCFAVLLFSFAVCLGGCHPLYGFVESEFELSPESRLPKWFSLPDSYSRQDLTVTLTFYSHPLYRKVKIKIYGPAPARKKLAEEIGTNRWHPITDRQFKAQGTYNIYPNYSIIDVKGTDEIYEQRRPEPFLYIADSVK